MYKITVKSMKNGDIEVNKDVRHANGLEALAAIDSIIFDIEEFTGLSYRKVIKLIKEARKCAEIKEVIDNDNINNTNE